jgi:hypothetical protein
MEVIKLMKEMQIDELIRGGQRSEAEKTWRKPVNMPGASVAKPFETYN